MRSNIRVGLAVLGMALASGLTLPSIAQAATPITDEYGFTGTSPDGATWLESINEQYGFSGETPVTDAQSSDVPVWAESIREEYGVPSETAAAEGTPVTDEFGGTGTSPDTATWYETMKETYGIGLNM
ncbi:MAG: hypothetical protein KME07_23505 [Pegethrix bostrychoides GSE-TBD4-15B]|uniref:Uncharacterized protein n=1 Tax=Pegethrix bostrychoides GSE-TBD4-15B TaxID=2839662 RepID=A0A951U6X4_9CYAN|nr:hypothetical protein [Pegethrix bostrychoides GSE-TBD4-15B]